MRSFAYIKLSFRKRKKKNCRAQNALGKLLQAVQF